MDNQPRPERGSAEWALVERLFAGALDHAPAERSGFLRAACGDDAALFDCLQRLLRAHDRTDTRLDGIDAGAMAELVRSTRETRIGPYRVIRPLARGGMGWVYLADDERLGRQVALKVLPPWLETDRAARERFLVEARAASAIDHPNVATIYDVGELPDAGLYIALAYYDGATLADCIAAGPLDVPVALDVAAQVAAALAAAHARGIVHRDIKPANVLLTADHVVKVLDFGIARMPGAALTRAGERLGTVAYMSPEQTHGEAVDARTDVWSLGVLLYEMLTGRRPFAGDDDVVVIHAIRHDDPTPATELCAQLPPQLGAIIERCLAKEPARRYADGDAVLTDLRALTASGVPAARRRQTERVLSAIAAALVVASGAAYATLMRSSRAAATAGVDPQLVMVLPFGPAVDDVALARVGRDLVITLSTNLDGVGELRAVDGATVAARTISWSANSYQRGLALARELGAGRVIHGGLVRSGGDVRGDIVVYRTSDGSVEARATATSPPADISALTDSITWALLRQLWPSRRAPRLEPNALSTRSLPALRAFLEGEIATAQGRWRAAADHYARALTIDSTFWFAYWRYAGALEYRSQPADTRVRELVWRHRFELPERERALIEAGRAVTLTERLEQTRAVTRRFPDSWRAWFSLAELLIHQTTFLGTTVADARAAMERAVALHPTSSTLWQHLFWMTLADQDTAAMRHTLERLDSLAADSAAVREVGINTLTLYRGLHRLSLRGGEPWAGMAEPLVAELARYTGPLDLENLSGDLSVFGFHRGELAAAETLLRHPLPASATAGALRATAQAFAGRGAWDSVIVALERYVARVDGPVPLQHACRLATVGVWLRALPDDAGSHWCGMLARDIAQLDVRHRAERLWLDGVRAFASDDTAGLDAARTRLVLLNDAAPHLARSLDAFRTALRGAVSEAADSLLELERQRAELFMTAGIAEWHPYLTAVNRLSAADWLLAADRAADAARLLRWHDAVLTASAPGRADATLRGVIHSRRARAEELLGRNAAATAHYRRVLRELDLPAPVLQPLVDTAAARLARLPLTVPPAR